MPVFSRPRRPITNFSVLPLTYPRLHNLAKRALTAHHDDLKEFLGGPELEAGVEMLILSVSNRAGVLHADRECTYHEYRHNRYILGFP
jgi:hypothetical protein